MVNKEEDEDEEKNQSHVQVEEEDGNNAAMEDEGGVMNTYVPYVRSPKETRSDSTAITSAKIYVVPTNNESYFVSSERTLAVMSMKS
eukprot:4447562-Ditylum_brightwellii.AAC.1